MSLVATEMLNTLAAEWGAMRLDTLSYVSAAEPLARSAAASGNPFDLKRLAVVLHIKGSGLRQLGWEQEGVAAEIECMEMLDRLADAGDDNAIQLLTLFSRRVSPYALGAAIRQRLAEGASVVPRHASEVVSASRSVLPLPTRRERVRWWFEDRWDDLRWRFDGVAWGVRRLWWRLADLLARPGQP